MRNLRYLLLLFALLIMSFLIGFIGYKIYDSKIEVKNLSQSNNIIQQNDKVVNATREKVSPNAILVIRTYYDKCGHDEEKEVELPVEFVNCTQEEIENKYNDLELELFSSNKLVFLKKEKGICNNHYVLKEKNNEINIYKLKTDGGEVLYDKTNISKEYLSDIDVQKLEEGIKIFGKEELNKVLEDYE